MKPISSLAAGCLVMLGCMPCGPASRADPVSTLQLLRVSGCAGVMPALRPLQHNACLDRAALLWSAGGSPLRAAMRSGYETDSAVGLRLSGPDDAILRSLRQTRCRALATESLQDVGVYRSGRQYWIVLATAGPRKPVPHSHPPLPLQTAGVASRVLEEVNAVRAHGTRCGDRTLAPSPPLRMSAMLASVAAGHALDMAQHDYFEHVDLRGQSPADRLRATGYRASLVGENIAYGPATADEVVSGWLHSAGHCENIMDPRFVEMGVAYAPGQGTRRGLYWDQEFATPAK